MMPLPRSSRWSYLLAFVGAVLVTVTCGYTEHSPLSFLISFAFILAVMAAGLTGGWKSGVLATLLCVIFAIYFVVEPVHTFWKSSLEYLPLVPYAGGGVVMAVLCELLLRAWRRNEERQERLEAEIIERRKIEAAQRGQAEFLRDADRRKDEFLATLAHELRNPLSPLSNALELWPVVENNREEMEKLRHIMERQLRQMTRLIDDLLDVSRISRGKIELRTQPADLATVVSGAVESLRPFIESCGHQLTLSLPKEPLQVNGDVARLTQAIGNLVHNAAKYTGGNGTIWVIAERDNDRAVVRIKDNGPGIPGHLLSQIFEMFEQVDHTLDRAHGGLGIGLTLARRLVELHGGTIEAHSEGIGRGSEFVIFLPAVARSSDPNQACGPRYSLRTIGGMPRHRILVVDDVRPSATTLAMMLEAMGQDASIAFDGASAVEWVRAHQPHIVFLDIAMPGMDGYEAARRIRAARPSEEPLLVALTGYGQEEDRRRAFAAGFNRHITKPHWRRFAMCSARTKEGADRSRLAGSVLTLAVPAKFSNRHCVREISHLQQGPSE